MTAPGIAVVVVAAVAVATPVAASRPTKHVIPEGASRWIEVSRSLERAYLIDRRRVVRTLGVSTGAPATPTPPGRYVVSRKELHSWSYPFHAWLHWAVYFNRGIAFHAWSVVPPYPASHGCVRVRAPDAPLLYRFAVAGMPVIVI